MNEKIKIEMWPGFFVALTKEGWKKHIKMTQGSRSEQTRIKGKVIKRELERILKGDGMTIVFEDGLVKGESKEKETKK